MLYERLHGDRSHWKERKSWERAAAAAVKAASESFADRCLPSIARDGAAPAFSVEVVALELRMADGRIDRVHRAREGVVRRGRRVGAAVLVAPGLSYAPRFSYAPPPRFFSG